MQLYRNFPGESTIFMDLDKNFEELFEFSYLTQDLGRSCFEGFVSQINWNSTYPFLEYTV